MEWSAKEPSKKYAYRIAKNLKNLAYGEWSCRIDELCAAVTYTKKGRLATMVYYYDSTPDANASLSDAVGIKTNCRETSGECN